MAGDGLVKHHDFAPPVQADEPVNETQPTRLIIDSDTDNTDTATNSSDEFDWDEDEEGRTNVDPTMKIKARRGRRVYVAFMKLARPVRVLLIGALGAGLFIAPLLVFQFRFKSSPVQPHVHVWSLWITIIWAAGCGTYLLVDAIPRLVISVIVLFGGQVERLKIQIELTMAVSAWLKLALDISWAWISLSVIRAIYHPPGSYWTIVNRVMQALFSAGIILLIEKLFLHFVAINFHQKALADRLAENRLGLKALDLLSNAQPAPSHMKKTAHKRGHRSTASGLELNNFATHKASKLGQTSLTPTDDKPKKTTRHEDRQRRRRKAMTSIIVDQLGGAIGQVALKNSRFNREGEMGSLHSARLLARKLFSTLSAVEPPRSHLIVEDFEPYFRTTAEAHAAYHLFDQDGNGDISKKEMREAVQRIYRERKSLVASLKDAGSAVAKLDAVLVCVALVAIIFVCLLIFNRANTLSSLVPLATIVLGFSFIFGHSAQTLFESLIFIFSTHVFDVGDLVMIDDQVLEVREFGLFSTTFRRVDGQEIIAPNALLASSKLVHNLRRSSSMTETTNLMISYNTPLENIEELRSKILQYVAENNREWSSAALHIDKMEYQNAIHLIVAMEHRPNWQDWGGRWARRTAFMRNLKTVLEELDIRYTMPVQPVIMPRAPPGPGGSPRSPVMMQQPPSGLSENFGNAGRFQGSSSQYLRAPGGSFRSEVDTF
ncbi:Mechanosensitive ion channel-domain-containing protein [Mycena floridula]|nr:Mechanosensitive ion channel-domain-containing protein [Mycena floridula]